MLRSISENYQWRILVVFVCWGFVGLCFQAGCAPTGGNGGQPSGDDQATVVGSVKDVTGKSVSNVQVSCGSAGTTTDQDGRFQLDLSAGDEQIIVFSRSGYVTSSVRVSVNETTITGPRNASITAPPNAFVDADGQPVTGEVEVHLTPFDPADLDELTAYPGELRGLTLDGETVPLVTYGLMDVTVTQDGQPLQIADGQAITVQIPAPTTDGNKPETSEVWIYNADSGLWIQSEYGDAVYDPQTDTYVAAVGHLSPLNVDRPIVPTCIRGIVQDADGDPVAGAQVRAVPTQAGRVSMDYTDAYGYFCMYVERNADMQLEIWTPVSDTCPESMRQGSYCVTARDLHSGSGTVQAGYPADCSTNCTVLPPITVETDDPGPLDEAACVVSSTTDNPFWGTCASGLTTFYECYAPQGRCYYEINPFDPFSSFEIEFENGSRMESEYSALEGVVIKAYGPDSRGNPLCGTIGMEGNRTTITTPSGQTYTIEVTEDGQMEVGCPGGFEFVLDPAQVAMLSSCSGSYEDGDGVACEPKPGTLGSDCTFDSDCTGTNLTCCGPPGGERTCQISSVCNFLCDDDWDCDQPNICCSAGNYNICMPASACP